MDLETSRFLTRKSVNLLLRLSSPCASDISPPKNSRPNLCYYSSGRGAPPLQEGWLPSDKRRTTQKFRPRSDRPGMGTESLFVAQTLRLCTRCKTFSKSTQSPARSSRLDVTSPRTSFNKKLFREKTFNFHFKEEYLFLR